MAASELDELSNTEGNTEQETNGISSVAAAEEFDETASEESAGEDEAGASAAGPEPNSEPGSEPSSEPASASGQAPEPLAESPETQSESNPIETAPLNAESSTE